MMQTALFHYDFGTLPSSDLTLPLTNLTELIRTPELDGLLRLCDVGALREGCSDYEWFEAFCRNAQQLAGNAAFERAAFPLGELYGADGVLSVERAAPIWCRGAERLMRTRTTLADLILQLTGCDRLRVLTPPQSIDRLPEGFVPVLLADPMQATAATDWSGWEQELAEVLEGFQKAGGDTVYLTLPEDFEDVRVDLYHLESALQGKASAEEGRAWRMAQLLRYLMRACKERELTLQLDLRADPREISSLLIREAKELPRVVWMTHRNDVRDMMLALTLHAACDLRWCLRLCDYPSDAELRLAIAAYVARYPRGRMTVSTGSALLDTAYERRRLMRIL